MTSASPLAVPSIPGAPVAFHLLAKPTGTVRNIDCAYAPRFNHSARLPRQEEDER